jgi:hypothetical protein
VVIAVAGSTRRTSLPGARQHRERAAAAAADLLLPRQAVEPGAS